MDAVMEMKRRNPTWGCPRIAQQITLAFGLDIDQDVVRRFLENITGQNPDPVVRFGLPSWVRPRTVCGVPTCFVVNRLSLRTHWVLVVMDQFTRRINGFGIHR